MELLVEINASTSRKSLRFSDTNSLKNIPIVYSMKALILVNDAPEQS
ncbi:hypothetical protein GLV98_13650 [Halobacillus litoralis]|uniref:Uncharacterized protein n=1 Tax=Halobacillus litoralis TaxID=45668 RepID=A0A845E420_9BACI|nr:hypothetical protein [Halobacillus litoralis]MYL50537.1 hypothetical protein [Halobacillus litoralis]